MKIIINGLQTETFKTEAQLVKRLKELKKAHVSAYFDAAGTIKEAYKNRLPELKIEIVS